MSVIPTHRKPWMRYVTGDLIADGKLSIGDGYRAKNSELGSSGLPFARVGNIDGGFNFDDADRFPEKDLGKVGDKISQPGDVVFTSKGTVGRLALVREITPRFVYAPQICFWRTLDPALLDSRWLYYWMFGKEFGQQISAVKGQTDMADYVSLGDQRRMEVWLPPIDEQHAIAGVLGALDDKIEQNRQTAGKLERLTRATFRAWFVDFEPVKAKAAGADSFPSMPQHIFDSQPTRFVDSEIGPVPEGWEVKALSTICTLVSGGTPKRSDPSYWSGDVPWYSVKDAPREGETWVINTDEDNHPRRSGRERSEIGPQGMHHYLCPRDGREASDGWNANGLQSILLRPMAQRWNLVPPPVPPRAHRGRRTSAKDARVSFRHYHSYDI